MHGKEDYYSKTGIFKPYYNLQIGVSDEYILHLGVYPNPTDTKTFIPFLETYFERYKSNPKYPVADAGYGSYDNYLYCLDHDMGLFMKYGHFNKENESKFKRKIYNVKNMDITPNKITAIDGTTYTYSHDYIQRRGLYPQHKKVYNHNKYTQRNISYFFLFLIYQYHAYRLKKLNNLCWTYVFQKSDLSQLPFHLVCVCCIFQSFEF